MTIVVSGVLSNLITVTVDSAVTNTFADKIEFQTGRKIFVYPGVGYVATWGARVGNNIGKFLDNRNISNQSHNVQQLSNLVKDYLQDHYQPHDIDPNHEAVGYHVGGFDSQNKPHLYHIFWGINDPPQDNETKPSYHYHEETNRNWGAWLLLYNGRNDLANTVIKRLLHEIQLGKPTRYYPGDPRSIVVFGDFIARFAGELTPEVGPPFITHLISPTNQIKHITNKWFSKLETDTIFDTLVKLGYQISGDVHKISTHEATVRNTCIVLKEIATTGATIHYKLHSSYQQYLYLNDNTPVNPDIFLKLPSNTNLYEDGNNIWHGVPDLIIEVISPTSMTEDRIDRFEDYRSVNVPEYWIVDPLNDIIEVWSFEGLHPERIGICGEGSEGFNSKLLSVQITQEMVEKILNLNQH